MTGPSRGVDQRRDSLFCPETPNACVNHEYYAVYLLIWRQVLLWDMWGLHGDVSHAI